MHKLSTLSSAFFMLCLSLGTWAEDNCNEKECSYTVSLEKAGFYIAVAKLPPGQPEGLWSLILNPPSVHRGSFHGGGLLEKTGTIPSWVGFSLAQSGMVSIKPFNYSDNSVPFYLKLMKTQMNNQHQLVWGPELVYQNQTYLTPSLQPGFYLAETRSIEQRQDFFGLSVSNPSLFGGVSGSWLDSQTGVGFAAFDITRPQEVMFNLWFGQSYGDLGAGKPYLEVYYQNEDGTRESYWAAPNPIEIEPPPVLAQHRSHRVSHGSLTNSRVEFFQLWDLEYPIFVTLTDENSYFGVDDALTGRNENELLLVKITEGQYTDANDDGIQDTPISNQDTVHALATVTQLSNGVLNVSSLSDIAWLYTKNLLDNSSNQTILLRLRDLAKTFIGTDLNGDGNINELDLLTFDSQNDTHKEKLNFNYAVLFKLDSENDSIISSYHGNKPKKRLQLLERTFGDRLSLYPAKDSRATEVKVEVIPFGKGAFAADLGGIDYNSERNTVDNRNFDFYAKGDSMLTITATPKTDDPNTEFNDGTNIIGWGGCDSVSSDLSQCQVSLQTDHQITVTFGYQETQLVDNFVDLSEATVTIDNNTLHVIIDRTNTQLINKASHLATDYYVTGSTGEGFLKKVVSVNKRSDNEYYLETIEASLEEVVKQGTGIFSKVMTNEDIDTNQLRRQTRRATKKPLTPGSPIDPISREIPFSDIEGVSLIRSENPKDDTFTIHIEKSESSPERNTRGLSEGIGGGISGEVVLLKDEYDVPLLTAKGEVKLNLKIDFDISYGFFSGLEYFKLVPEVNANEKLEVFVGGEVPFLKSDCDKSPKGDDCYYLGTIPFKKFRFFIGLLPVYISSQLDVYMGFDGKITGQISSGVEFKQQLRAGLVYNENAGINFIGEFNHNEDFLEPKAEYSAEAKSFIGPEVSAKLYGMSKMGVPINGYFKLKTDESVDFNINTWKNSQCLGGTNYSAWIGLDSEFKWDLLSIDDKKNDKKETIQSKLGKFLKKHLGKKLSKLEDSYQLFKKEWLIKRGNIGGICDETKTPPYLKVEGDHINETVTASSNTQITQDYVLSNTGGTELNWTIDFREDNALTISKKSGKLAPSETDTVTIAVDTSKLSIGNYRNLLQFVNNYEVGLLEDKETGTTERNVSIEVVLCQPEDCTKATSNGDPHLYTFDNLAYDFQAVGEFILVTDGSFEIQVRQIPWRSRNDVAITQAIAMNVAGDRVGFYLDQNPLTRINGNPQEVTEANTTFLANGGRVIKRGSTYMVIWPDGNGAVEVKNNGWGLLVSVYISNSQKGNLVGLLGNADTDPNNDITTRDGTNLGTTVEFSTLYPGYADSWRISQAESLFDYAPGETTDTFTNYDFPEVFVKASELSADERASAEKICRDARIVDQVLLENCILDIALTGKQEFAQLLPDLDKPMPISVSKAPPKTDCRAHFTGLVLADHYTPGHISEVYVEDSFSEYVSAGKYPDNNLAFPKAVATTFDGIAIDAGTKVTIFSGKNFTGDILYEKVGPAILNNVKFKTVSCHETVHETVCEEVPENVSGNTYGSKVETTWKEPLESNYPPSVREWSTTDMWDWSIGSVIVECGYNSEDSKEATKSAAMIVAEATKGKFTETEGEYFDTVCEESLRYDTEIIDLNNDGQPEVFTNIYGACMGGMAGVSMDLYIKNANGEWISQFGFPGFYHILETKNKGYPDIEIGGPGFCFPVWRWNGKEYDIHKRCPI